MIVSVSRRTDIPAFYYEWFYNRIKDGEVLIRNPFNRIQISRIILNPNTVDCFVFWTKDPYKFIKKIHLLRDYNYYFQFTLNPYRDDIEKGVRKKKYIMETFKELSLMIGKEKVIWRYDPILLNDYYNKEYHYTWFEKFCMNLEGYTEKCVISFIDEYKKIRENSNILNLRNITNEDMKEIGKKLVKIANKYNIIIETCAERIDLSFCGINHGQCIDGKLISRITGKDFTNAKLDNIRKGCRCLKSVDIGEYNSCMHRCTYCYANYNSKIIENNIKKHDKNSKLLLGNLQGDEKITYHYLIKEKMKNNKSNQLSFL
ncbi:DUF1848 domain-containing protein [Haloimpatiens sp. FM7330]|uniref:DUF1848 domain-containing protein n=1 Tax=Haloimpatiens sp. FM7330 TaxID=3298610 RepID=UPI00362F777D